MRFNALWVSTGLFSNRTEFAEFATRYAVSTLDLFAELGRLMSYGSSLADQYRETGTYTGGVLNGERPINMPVISATKFELVIKLKPAMGLGI